MEAIKMSESESAGDIQEYSKIIQGKLPNEEIIAENQIIDLGISTAGADVGQTYIFDNGIRWAKIISEKDDHWQIEHGLLEYESDDIDYISKYDITKMIRSGEMILTEVAEDDLDELFETYDEEIEDEFTIFMEKVDRYLLINYERESKDFEYLWEEAWKQDKQPIEAADEAVIFEG